MLPMLRHELVSNFPRAVSSRSFGSDKAKPPNGIPENNTSPSYTEVEVPVPWGHISGKWWGSQDQIPIIALHGFEDNAGTYDRLAPLLDVPAIFAWDAPGHGRSSHMPVGHTYHFADFLISLRLLIRRFGWEKVSLMGHSWGSATALMYSALFPESVEHYVSIDCARTLMPLTGVLGVPRTRKIINHMIKYDNIVSNNLDPPAYNMQQVQEMIVQGTFQSVTPENCEPLIKRGTLPHPKVPDKVYFSRDLRLRVGDACRPTVSLATQAAGKVRCHVLSILAKQGFVAAIGDDVERVYRHQEGLMQQGAASFRTFNVKGSHHLHLNTPERVAPLINEFFSQTQ